MSHVVCKTKDILKCIFQECSFKLCLNYLNTRFIFPCNTVKHTKIQNTNIVFSLQYFISIQTKQRYTCNEILIFSLKILKFETHHHLITKMFIIVSFISYKTYKQLDKYFSYITSLFIIYELLNFKFHETFMNHSVYTISISSQEKHIIIIIFIILN